MAIRSGSALKIFVVILATYGIHMILTMYMDRQISLDSHQAQLTTKEFQNLVHEENSLKNQIAQLKQSLDELDSESSDLERKNSETEVQMKHLEGFMQEAPQSFDNQHGPKNGGKNSKEIGGAAYVSFPHNRIVSASPYCKSRTEMNNPKEKLPIFVFVAGIEGSGHHALKSIWHHLGANAKIKLIVYDQLFHSFGIENHASYHYSSILSETHYNSIKKVFEEAKANGEIVVDAQNSYPMGKGAGSMAHPDLLMLKHFDGVLYDLRVVILNRDPTSSVLSAVRRFRDDGEYSYKNFQFQARMVTESLAHLNNVMPHLSCNKYMVLNFEDFVKTPTSIVGDLSKLTEIPQKLFLDAMEKIKKPEKHHSSEGDEQRAILKEYFEIQQIQWPLLQVKRSNS